MDSETAKKLYGAKWRSWKLIPVGAGWAFAVGIIEQGGRVRVRVAKGKMKVVEAGELPITQAQKFNLKVKDWKELRSAIDDAIRQLDERVIELADAIEPDQSEAEGPSKLPGYIPRNMR